MRRIALLAGATGLVGRDLLPLLLDDGDIEEVVSLSRRPLATPHPKLQQGIAGVPGINEAVLAGIKSAKFRPATKNGLAVKMWRSVLVEVKP